MSKIITVFGATGQQGGSVVSKILSTPSLSSVWTVRAVTRDPSRPNAAALRSRGAEVVKGDLNDAATILPALQGSEAVFAVTNYWEDMKKATELAQGKAIADACKQAGVKHLIWSALPNVSKVSNGSQTDVHHFDSKAEIAEYIEAIKGDMAATHVMAAFFMQNLSGGGFINKGEDGSLSLNVPWDADKTQLPLIDIVADMGNFVAGVLQQPREQMDGKWVQAVGEWVTPRQVVETIKSAAGLDVAFNSIPEDVFKGFLPPAMAAELTANMVWIRDGSYYGLGAEKKQAESTRLAVDKPVSWEDYVKKTDWKF